MCIAKLENVNIFCVIYALKSAYCVFATELHEFYSYLWG